MTLAGVPPQLHFADGRVGTVEILCLVAGLWRTAGAHQAILPRMFHETAFGSSRPSGVLYVALVFAGAVRRLANMALHSALRAWREWAAERGQLRATLQRMVTHWQHQTLSIAFARFR